MKQTQQEITQDIAVRRREEAEELMVKTRMIRNKITQASGDWDAAAVIREIRYGE